MRQMLIRTYRWLVDRPSYMLLTAGDERLADAAPERFGRAWIGLVGLSLLWGIAMAYLFGAAGSLFGEVTGLLMMPAAVVTTATVAWLYRLAVVDLARVVARSRAEQVAPVAAAVTLVLALAMCGLKSHQPDWSNGLPWFLHWIPRTMFRTLILAPVWGGWAMLITLQFCRPTEQTEPAVVALGRGCGPLTAAMCMLAPFAATVWSFRMFYHAHEWWQNLIIPAVTALTAIAGGWLICRLDGAPTRRGLLATNMLTQLVFILAYLAVIR